MSGHFLHRAKTSRDIFVILYPYETSINYLGSRYITGNGWGSGARTV
jgi:hypothetical protein